MVDLRKGKEQVGVVGADFIYYLRIPPRSITNHTTVSMYDTEKYREFPGVPVRKVENWDLGLGCIP